MVISPGSSSPAQASQPQMRSALLLCCLVQAPADRRRLAAYNYMEVAKLTAADAAAGDEFGRSVAIDGNTVVVGAHQPGVYDANLGNYVGTGSGAVYVFRTSDGGATYGQVAKLTASDAVSRDRFGSSVAIAGNIVVVGAYSGEAAYVFRTADGGATYGQVAKLTVSDASSYDRFGISVAIDGDTIVIGADCENSRRGAAYVFRTSNGGATYGQVAKLTAADAAAGDHFGYSVAIDSGTIVVGSVWDDDAGGNSGSAFVFRTSDGGVTYGQVAKLTAADAAAGDNFGSSVAIDGDTIVIGADQYSNVGSGVAYVLRTSDGDATYVEVAKLTAVDAAANDDFGSSVAIDGTTVVVGADQYSNVGSGVAYVFRTSDGGATYGQLAKLTASDAVAISNGTVVVGSPHDDDAGTNSGSAYVFSLLATKQVDDVLTPWEIALIAIACLIFGVGCFVCLRTMRKSPLSATAWTRTKAFGAAAMAWMRTKAHGAAATAARISPAAPPAAETPPMLRTTSVLPMGTVEAVQAPDAEAAPPILGEVVTHSTVLSVSN